MQASKIELHHTQYAVKFPEYIKHDDKRIRAPGELWRAKVTRINTYRHENGPAGMVQEVEVQVLDEHFPLTPPFVTTNPKAVLGKYGEYQELVERKEQERLESQRAYRAEQAQLALLIAGLRWLGFERTAERATSRSFRNPGLRTLSYSAPRIDKDEVPKMIALLPQLGVPVKDLVVDLGPDNETQG